MNEKESILKDLQPLFEKAEKEKLWFHASYHDLWFSPKELKEQQSNGKFLWGAVNWKLRSPWEKITEIQKRIEMAELELKEFTERAKMSY